MVVSESGKTADRRVLVIDDSDVARASMVAILEKAGFTVFQRSSPIGATADIVRHDVQVVVTDMNMPVMSGERFAMLLREKQRLSQVILILVTGEVEDKLEALGRDVQADAVMPKRRLSTDLVPLIERLLARILAEEAAPAGSGKVLVIDDEKSVLNAVRGRLESIGYEVATLDTSMGVLATIAVERPDFILLDLNMPGMRGPAVAELVRKTDVGKNIGIIFHSGLDPSEVSGIVRETGAVGIIYKSGDREGFCREFERLAAKHRLAIL